MIKKIPYKLAVNLTIGILSIVLGFHFLVLIQLIPYEFTWAGKLKSVDEMYKFEGVSIFLNLFLIWIVAMKAGFIKAIIPLRFLSYFILAMSIVFLLNTIGNLFAVKSFEMITGTPITFLLSVFCFRISRER